MNDDDTDFGPCCVCETEGAHVRNFLILHQVAPIPGTGWGCFVCQLPSNGALAVVCDDCLNKPLRFVINGRPADKQRAPYNPDAELFNHKRSRHPELGAFN